MPVCSNYLGLLNAAATEHSPNNLLIQKTKFNLTGFSHLRRGAGRGGIFMWVGRSDLKRAFECEGVVRIRQVHDITT